MVIEQFPDSWQRIVIQNSLSVIGSNDLSLSSFEPLLTRGLMGEIEEGLLPNSISWETYFLLQIVSVLKSS